MYALLEMTFGKEKSQHSQVIKSKVDGLAENCEYIKYMKGYKKLSSLLYIKASRF